MPYQNANPKMQFFDANGNPLAGGKVYTYAAGTTTPLATYTDRFGTILNTNPVILDSRGEADIWFSNTGLYFVTLKTALDVLVYTVDNMGGLANAANIVFTPHGNLTSTDIQAALAEEVDDLAAPSGASLIGDIDDGAGAVSRTVHSILRERVRVFGRMTTAEIDDVLAGTRAVDVRAKIQAAFDYAMTLPHGCVIEMPGGEYYLGAGYADFAQLSLGRYNGVGPNNVDIDGYGATLYQGASSKAFAVNKSTRSSIRGLKIIGYTGGTLGALRENDALITVNYNSHNVLIEDNYLTNSLGDCIYLGGSLVSGGELGYECRDITIRNNTLKERFGDGVTSFSGGTKSRLAIAVIDCVGLHVYDNTIYGAIDLETNLNGQHLVNLDIHNNKFRSGNVTAQSVIGTNYWYDEPINLSGGSVIEQNIGIGGVSATPVTANNRVYDNTFEYGLISSYGPYVFQSVQDNKFKQGQIRVGFTSGSNSTYRAQTKDNISEEFLTGETSFVRLDGLCYFSVFDGNITFGTGGYCVNSNGASTGDGGRCVFVNNIKGGSTSLGSIGFTPIGSSFASNNLHEAGAGISRVDFGGMRTVDNYSPLATLALSGTGLVINWITYRGNMWYLNCGSVATTISQIQNSPGDGFELTVFGGSSGGATLTFIQDASYFRLKSGVNAVLPDFNSTITFISRSGIWFEKCRNF